ncbi:bifunctional 4-hydroxy-3-methylbut-2-enyl diphosphate reductase/30S ribosomal protein S1 [Lawsonibacter sp. OA9]|uniref:4-hydroxy-3-methylbut-2-enyl diphosphate reductase n=1 Tax=Flintibacter hominis TaxID=2763048 RepID=A0A8J6IXN6_9FIRM|nr:MULTISPECIES: bifunctional 4-hydroxy-3-methylbut-2-enyl diphosphate reductase/30S ribosomal protein S1 [Eubacteriales]MBC5722335.1 bifunctional 4-hydroxy-3-methylbut-2-enyl diphosphate reductase/30S ribosomal protein S1 [Flintibacter hominis]MBS5589999.1 bifunctional 4-hydroxy-3-methylbut-2-enyl diphosphate reductase/30S ribosomal protein S1 [Clostridiales bacterium]MCH1979818.1 bifunctional 4-hydroxy-3-methylbut-2-enyl diphosphate reductase/30S ribosomal protein S1 [Lawsonibacter sp. OA9]SC
MKLELARSAGFCYGVRRAVELAEQAAAQGTPCVMLGSIIHNQAVIGRLAEQGLRSVKTPEEVPDGASVIIRSHGESRAVYKTLESRGAQILDATCPNVTRIHEIVRQAEEQGRRPVIVGTPDHPEVTAIAGWCREPVVVSGAEALEKWLLEAPDRRNLPITLVSQTTSTRKIWDDCVKKAKKECTNAEFFDTICGATSKRQEEARQLAEKCSMMVVIGDSQSSNTKRLAELCREVCPRVQLIESAEELDLTGLPQADMVGITAGASTPAWIIKEVYDKMSEEIMEIEQSFAEMLEESIKPINNGDKVTGIVDSITPTEIQVDLGFKYPGYIPLAELSDDPTVKPEDLVKVGDEIEAYVMQVSDRDCQVKLSKKRLDMVKGWEEIEAASENETVVEGFVTEDNKGGVVVSVKGIRVFVPASQTGLPRETPMAELLKHKVRLVITEVNRARRRVVGSISKVQRAERAAAAEKVWAEIEDGKRYTGTVKSLTSYGAFVDIGGVDGMVHISELSWSRIKHPSEVVKVGDTVEVYVISADKEKKKISLGMKDHSQDPWTVFTSTYQVGDTANVRIVKLMTFGAFAEVVPGVDGLIHISQIADHRIEKPGDVLAEGDKVDVKITDVDMENKKISLSIRALLEPAVEEDSAEEAPAETEE